MLVSWISFNDFAILFSLTDDQIQKVTVFENSYVKKRTFWLFESDFKDFDNLVVKQIIEFVLQHKVIEGWEKIFFPCYYFSGVKNIFFDDVFQNFDYFYSTYS